jgi:GT2 family glycosyltransferase
MIKVNCVIVTYNRLPLLKECIEAVLSQTFPVTKLIIVNNAITDNTKMYLDSLAEPVFEIINLAKNTGGSGGFNIGLKRSMDIPADWTWLMDDDTIPLPNALEELINRSGIVKNIGFLCSKVLYPDGAIHRNNLVYPRTLHNTPYLEFIEKGVLLAATCTFVSCLINKTAIKTVGFPIADFFIWFDDLEYTDRITRSDFFGMFVWSSCVIHKTSQNHASSINEATKDVFWKFYYGERNSIYLLKHKHPPLKFVRLYIKAVIEKCLLCLKNKDGSLLLLRIVLKGCIAGLFFNPKIEKYAQVSNEPPRPEAPPRQRALGH